jgi:hypothetical protein
LDRLPVEQLPARLKSLDLVGANVYHVPDWKSMADPERLRFLRKISMMRGRDPRIASLAVDIIKKAKVQPRDFKGQAAALLKWVQDPENVYYVNEPGERLQDPIYTLKVKYADCDDQVLLLCSFFESVRLPWKLVIAGKCKDKKVRFIEGGRYPMGCTWFHIYCMVGTPAFAPKKWYFCETTIDKVPLGWDILAGDKSYLPEGEAPTKAPGRLMLPPAAPPGFRPSKLPPAENRSPAYDLAYGEAYMFSPVGAAVGASIASDIEDMPTGGKSTRWLDFEKLLPGIVTGIAVSVTVQLALDWIRPKLFSKRQDKDS